MKIQFQTGRQYSAHGQRIVAKQEAGTVVFKDHDRFIAGAIPCLTGREMDLPSLREFVMFNYDHGNYRGLLSDEVEGLDWEEGK